ncbi:MAG TPA: transcription antitermination factor NusB [Gemmatimonadaceae bacterium]
MSRTRIETRARARALQALYAWDMRQDPASDAPGVTGPRNGATGQGVAASDAQSLVQVAEHIWDDMRVTSEERSLAGALVGTVASDCFAIDAALAEVTTNWRLGRLGAIERSVLRLGAAELHRGEVPTRVVIQEGVRLAERYGSAQSARFVNGVLDALARRMGKL